MLQLKNKKKIYFYLFSFLFLSTITNDDLKKNFDQKWLEMSLKLIPAKLGFIKTLSFIVINLTIK